MEFRLRNLILANIAVLAASLLAFLHSPLAGYAVIAAVVVTDLVVGVQLLARARQTPARRPGERYRVEIEPARCIGQGNCVKLAPGAFALDAAGKAELIGPEAPPALLLDAARGCPVDAIFLYDRAGRQVYPDPNRPWQKKRVRAAPGAGGAAS